MSYCSTVHKLRDALIALAHLGAEHVENVPRLRPPLGVEDDHHALHVHRVRSLRCYMRDKAQPLDFHPGQQAHRSWKFKPNALRRDVDVQYGDPLAVPAQRPNVERLALHVAQQKEVTVLVFGTGDRGLTRIEAWCAPPGVPLDNHRSRVHRLLNQPEALYERQEPLIGAGAHGVASQRARYARRLVESEYEELASVVEHHGVGPDLLHPQALLKQLNRLIHQICGRHTPRF